MATAPDQDLAGRLRRTALLAGGVAGAMALAAFAAVPLYDLFCKATGYGGTPMVRGVHSERVSQRMMSVRFDANVAPGLNWRFEPESPEISARVGETTTISYRVTNLSDRPSAGMATFNVQPAQAGAYFVKMQCFCFTEHTLQPGESIEAPVVFYVDPDIEKNPELNALAAITLSYTYFPAKGGQPLASAGQEKPKL